MDALLEAALRLAGPLLLAALGELLIERTGVINIGLEGVMLCGAFGAFACAVATGSPAIGVVTGGVAGCALGAVFALFAVVRRADQIVVGTAINLLALGLTGVASRTLYGGAVPTAPAIGTVALPGLAAIPTVGPALFVQPPYVYAALALALAIGLFFRRTRPGLRWRAVGESARAADAEGVAVTRVRVVAVLVGTFLGGVAGSALPLSQSNVFTEGMTAGRGFIALAIVIFGRWSPLGVTLAALFFGAAHALQFWLQARGFDLPYPLFLMFPYAVTLAVLGFSTGRARAPEDLGRAYRREAA
ncbi:MAG TPA: ABC transporter permease [Myxococcota bacterium]|nr:ABC transporter permease [Myxococcota bacterium]